VIQVDADALDRRSVRIGPPDGARARSLVGCGWTEIDTDVRIVDPATRQPCARDCVGEIWVAGSTVAAGYWRRERETEQTFRATLASEEGGAFLRTGDLGFVYDGDLYVTGRIKEMLIVRGQNYYPQDIELTVERCHSGFRQNGCAAFAVDLDGEEQLVIALELEREGRAEDLEELAGLVRQAVAEVHEIRVYDIVWLRPNGIPRTSSGKIQRHACRLAYLEGFPGRLPGRAS
jgi:acyl-CoA synthetase (AMP-forming)/AMP-acid ligase II